MGAWKYCIVCGSTLAAPTLNDVLVGMDRFACKCGERRTDLDHGAALSLIAGAVLDLGEQVESLAKRVRESRFPPTTPAPTASKSMNEIDRMTEDDLCRVSADDWLIVARHAANKVQHMSNSVWNAMLAEEDASFDKPGSSFAHAAMLADAAWRATDEPHIQAAAEVVRAVVDCATAETTLQAATAALAACKATAKALGRSELASVRARAPATSSTALLAAFMAAYTAERARQAEFIGGLFATRES